MANTLIPIQTYTLTTTASSVTFSGIPQSYTDLKLVINARDSSSAGGNWNGYSMTIYPNGLSTNITQRSMFSPGSGTPATYSDSQMYTPIVMTADTASTFSNVEVYIANYTSGVNKQFLIDGGGEANATAAGTRIAAATWASTAAITSLQINAYSTFTAGSTMTLYGVSNGTKATGGTLTVAGGYAYHVFTSASSLTPNQQITNAEILVIAGGGGGGFAGGGGGAGGVVYKPSQTLNAGNVYTAMIGSGGAASSSGTAAGSNGSTSTFGSLIATGGGGGGSYNASSGNGVAGGSGGGASRGGAVGAGTVGQGNNGGLGNSLASGGGGGGGSTGYASPGSGNGGQGGDGTVQFYTWSMATGTGLAGLYAGGGGGGGSQNSTTGWGVGGQGGGGSGGYGGTNGGPGYPGSANTGGGGGGGGSGSSTDSGGSAGGSGIVIVRYPLA